MPKKTYLRNLGWNKDSKEPKDTSLDIETKKFSDGVAIPKEFEDHPFFTLLNFMTSGVPISDMHFGDFPPPTTERGRRNRQMESLEGEVTIEEFRRNQTLLREASRTIKAQQKQLEDLTAPAYPVATIVALMPETQTVVVESPAGGTLELERPSGFADLEIGNTVLLNPQTMQIVRNTKFTTFGETGTVKAVLKDLIQVQTESDVFSVQGSRISVHVGDKVVLNPSGSVILKRLEGKSEYAFEAVEDMPWEAIGGQEAAKEELRETLELPYSNSGVFAGYNKRPVKGFLFHGLPGNGKTLLGRAAASALARVHGRASAKSGFIYVKGPELLSKWVGESEERIRQLFASATKHRQQNGYPAVIFVDEADALLSTRGLGTTSGMEHTIVPQFLSEMDGLTSSDAIVLLATNRADSLDPAVIRPGRIDRLIYVAPPDKEAAVQIFHIHSQNLPVSKSENLESIIQTATESLFSDKFPLYEFQAKNGTLTQFNMGHLISGAMVAGIVERATSIAIKRDLKSNHKKPSGLTMGDFEAALQKVYEEQHGINHTVQIHEFMTQHKDLVAVRRKDNKEPVNVSTEAKTSPGKQEHEFIWACRPSLQEN